MNLYDNIQREKERRIKESKMAKCDNPECMEIIREGERYYKDKGKTFCCNYCMNLYGKWCLKLRNFILYKRGLK